MCTYCVPDAYTSPSRQFNILIELYRIPEDVSIIRSLVSIFCMFSSSDPICKLPIDLLHPGAPSPTEAPAFVSQSPEAGGYLSFYASIGD